MSDKKYVEDYFKKLNKIFKNIDIETIEEAKKILFQAWKRDKKIFVMGNGGSASTSTHMAADIGKGTLSREYDDTMKRFKIMSLTDNMASVMAFSNDYGYEHVFVQQLKNLVSEGDVVIGISASGNSPNVIEALDFANEKNAITIGLLGFDGGKIKDMVDVAIHIKDNHYGRVEDIHLIINHLFVDMLEHEMKKEKKKRFIE